jgi:erythromycin esterase
MRLRSPLLLALLALPALADEDPRVAWLKAHAVPLASIDPAAEDFADLGPLREAIGDARIVLLGEQSHGDGAAFLAKTRLIRFLHREMGFDVLAFESGLYDCRVAWERFVAGDAPLEAARQGVFGIWTQSEQVRPLFEHLAASAKSDRPLELCGFDCQFTANASNERLLPDLEAAVAPLSRKEKAAWDDAKPAVEEALAGEDRLKPPARAKGARALREIAAALAKGAGGDAERAWLARLFTSVAAQVEVNGESHQRRGPTKPSDVNRRDAAMAENLVWLAEERYAGRRILVWAATFHIAREVEGLKPLDGRAMYDGTVPMGRIVAERFGSGAYVVGFTASEGSRGVPWAAPSHLPAAPEGSFEALCAAAGLENAFVDLRGRGEEGAWLARPLVMRPLGYAPMTADWTKALDAVVYTRVMTPSTREGADATPAAGEGPKDLPSRLRAAWEDVQRGREQKNVWVDKWDFAEAFEGWRASADAEQIAGAERVVRDLWPDVSDPDLAWRVQHLLHLAALARGDRKAARAALERALDAYPERLYADARLHGKAQHLLNDLALLVWDQDGFDAALEVAADHVAKDAEVPYFHPDPWFERATEREREEIVDRIRKAYAARARRFPAEAERARGYADALR